MRIFDKKCYATYAGEGELVVLLKEFEDEWIKNYQIEDHVACWLTDLFTQLFLILKIKELKIK
jgi:hypothetical protein